MFSYSLERAGGKFTVTPTGYILINDSIDRETADVHSFQVSFLKSRRKRLKVIKKEELKPQYQRARRDGGVEGERLWKGRADIVLL